MNGAPSELMLGGLVIDTLTFEDIIEDLSGFRHQVTVNAEAIARFNESTDYAEAIAGAAKCIDGTWPLWFARLKYLRTDFPINKLSGSDLIWRLAEYASRNGHKLFLLGASASANASAVKSLQRATGAAVAGHTPPYSALPFSKDTNRQIRRAISTAEADIILVALGMPKQALWIYDNRSWLQEHGIHLAVGVGGAVDMVGNAETRAPPVTQRLGLEWLWRLLHNPRRITRLPMSLRGIGHLILR